MKQIRKLAGLLVLPVLSAFGLVAGGDRGAARDGGFDRTTGIGNPVVSRIREGLPSFLGGPTPFEKQAAAYGVETRTIRIGGRKRRYHFYVPRSIAASGNAPMVLALHGGGGNALQFVGRIDGRGMAERHGFVVVAPQGYGWWWSRRGSWNADSTTRLGMAERKRIDDIAFLDAVIRSMPSEVGVDPARVYVMGMSKGGMMAYRLACAIPDRIAAIAVVAGTLSTDLCPDGAAVPLLHIHGTEDENVPLEGGRGRFSARGANWPEVARGIDVFRRANRCTGEPRVTRVAPDTVCRSYACAGRDDVQFCLVEGGGHAWPGIAATRRQKRRGVNLSRRFNATEYIARFFLRH